MKIQLASDLHLEFLERRLPRVRLIEPAPGADVLVLAGDIHHGIGAVKAFAHWPVPVLLLAGNHEFYGRSREQTRADLRGACIGAGVHFLDNDAVEIGGVRFLGCTLWTDFLVCGAARSQAMREVERGLNDYALIQTQQGPLRARQTLADHEQSRAWLESELAKSYEGKTVVVTHHGPHPGSIHPRFAASTMNAGFVSDLSPLLQHADLWLHGHVHDSVDYPVGPCRVVANPAGYVLNLRAAIAGARIQLENRMFDPALVIEVG